MRLAVQQRVALVLPLLLQHGPCAPLLHRGAPAPWPGPRPLSDRACIPAKMSGGASEPRTGLAIITGVGSPSGIGRGLAGAFLDGGWDVGGIDVLPQEEVDLRRESFQYARADVSEPGEVSAAVEKILGNFRGRSISVVINNAGISDPALQGEGRQERMKSFKRFLDVNLFGAFVVTEACLPRLDPAGSSIIHISSTRARMSEPHTEGYAASKGGLCALAHAQAISLASSKVRVNAVLPGWIDTGGYPVSEADASFHPAGRVGVPDDIAQICLFLADATKSGFVTGQEFVVDGGVTKKMIYPETE